MPIDTSMADIYTNTQAKTGPQAIFAALQAGKKGNLSKEQIEKAAQDFESVFLGQMMQGMFPEDQEANELLGNSEGDEIFRGMMVDEYAKQISKSGGIGIAGYIQRELLGEQEFQPGKANNLKILKLEDAVAAAGPQMPKAQEIVMAKAETQAKDQDVSDADATLREIFQGGNSL